MWTHEEFWSTRTDKAQVKVVGKTGTRWGAWGPPERVVGDGRLRRTTGRAAMWSTRDMAIEAIEYEWPLRVEESEDGDGWVDEVLEPLTGEGTVEERLAAIEERVNHYGEEVVELRGHIADINRWRMP
jgi:hypothetical protein